MLYYSSFLRFPAGWMTGNSSVIEQSLNKENAENVSQIIQTSVGPKESGTDGIQPCFTYNPPASNQPGLTPDRNVRRYN